MNNSQVTYGFVPEPQRFVKGQNEKYLGTSKVGEYYVRFLGSPHKFYFHYRPDGRKICPKTLGIRAPESKLPDGSVKPGGYMYTKLDETGAQVPYTPEESFCPICETGDTCRKRFVINAIDLREMADLAKRGLPPIVRIMEFPKQIWDQLIQYTNSFRIMPSDVRAASNFKIQAYYPDKFNPQPRDILYKLSWDKPGASPLSEDVIGYLENGNIKVWDLVKEYHPLLQKKQSVFPQPEATTVVPPQATDKHGFYAAPNQTVAAPVAQQQIVVPTPQPQAEPQQFFQASPQPQVAAQQFVPAESQQVAPPASNTDGNMIMTFGEDVPAPAAPAAAPAFESFSIPTSPAPAAPVAPPAQPPNGGMSELETLLASLQTQQ